MTNDYTNYAGEEHRKKFGQFFTHPMVARFMVRWVMKSERKGLFDPAFGLGAFREQIPKNARSRFSAMEIDPEIIKFWVRASGESGGFISCDDYLRSWGRRHQNIVCNPPYMRFQKFLNRDAVFSEFEEHTGMRLSGYTNTASAFLIKSIEELGEDGRLAYVMPLEFLNTGYGKIVKKRLLADRHLYSIISVDCEKEVFPDATTSVGIVLYDKAGRHGVVKFHSLKKLGDLAAIDDAPATSEIDYEDLDANMKWLPFFREKEFSVERDKTTQLHFFGRFSRGIATGANEFFVLNRSRIQELCLDEGVDCIPCITKSAQIVDPFFEGEDLERLKSTDKPVFLFSVNGVHSSGADSYIEEGVGMGYHERYLTKCRNPWYKTESREPAPLLLGVFSRGGYKVISNESGAVNLTCYHGFQPNLFGGEYTKHLFLYLSSNAGRKIVTLSVRKYGDSLDKFEPNDINNALVPTPEFFDRLTREDVDRALDEYRRTLVVPQWIERIFDELRTPVETRNDVQLAVP